jgi:hypothetical protein
MLALRQLDGIADAASSSGTRLATTSRGGLNIMVAAVSFVLIGIVGILFVRRREARKRSAAGAR